MTLTAMAAVVHLVRPKNFTMAVATVAIVDMCRRAVPMSKVRISLKMVAGIVLLLRCDKTLKMDGFIYFLFLYFGVSGHSELILV